MQVVSSPNVFETRCVWPSQGMNYFIKPRRCSVLPHAINPYSRAGRAVIGQDLLHLSAQLPLYLWWVWSSNRKLCLTPCLCLQLKRLSGDCQIMNIELNKMVLGLWNVYTKKKPLLSCFPLESQSNRSLRFDIDRCFISFASLLQWTVACLTQRACC